MHYVADSKEPLSVLALPEERHVAIKQRLVQHGRVLAVELAREFKTSEDTIRRDLRELAAAGLCRRVYGGALPMAPTAGTLAERNRRAPSRKVALGRAAAALVRSGDTVLIDAGSTNLQIVHHLAPDLPLTLITNAPSIADAMTGRPQCDLILIGGRVDPSVGGCIGARAIRHLQRIRADLCFLGACAANGVTGIAAFDPEEAEFKRTMIERSERIVVALTNDKLATMAPFEVSPLARLDDIVVEADAPANKLEPFAASGLRIHRAGAAGPAPSLAVGPNGDARTGGREPA